MVETVTEMTNGCYWKRWLVSCCLIVLSYRQKYNNVYIFFLIKKKKTIRVYRRNGRKNPYLQLAISLSAHTSVSRLLLIIIPRSCKLNGIVVRTVRRIRITIKNIRYECWWVQIVDWFHFGYWTVFKLIYIF